MIEKPWPEDPERVERRVRGTVESVVRPHELDEVRLTWVTPHAHRFDARHAGDIALRLTILATGNESYEREIWNPTSPYNIEWEDQLGQLASDLEDWVCETRFGWGQQRNAYVPD